LDDARFSSHPFHRLAEFMTPMTNREAAHLPEFDALQVGPEALAGMQLWGRGGEALPMEPLGRATGQELRDEVTAVDGRAIPEKHQGAGHLPQQVLEKRDHVVRVESTVLAVAVARALGGDSADRGQLVAGPPRPQDGGVA
jgi:hypothetical protein